MLDNPPHKIDQINYDMLFSSFPLFKSFHVAIWTIMFPMYRLHQTVSVKCAGGGVRGRRYGYNPSDRLIFPQARINDRYNSGKQAH